MDQQVVDLLNATQSADREIRTSAEQQLRNFQETEGDYLATSLINVGTTTSYPIALRQSALLVLKLTIARTWSLQFEEFVETALSPNVKTVIREELFQILRSPERKLRSLAANLVSKISSADFPDEWPELFDDLMSLLRSPETESVQGALSILKELLDDGLTFEQFASIASGVFDALYNLATSSSYDLGTKANTIDTVRAALNFFNQVETQGESMREFVCRAVDIWSLVFSNNLALPYTDEARKAGLVLLKHNTAKAIQQMDSTFPSQSKPYLMSRLFSSVWADLSNSSALYASVYINGESEDDLSDPEGEARYIKMLPLEEMEFIRQCVPNHQVQAFFKTSEENMQLFIDLSITMGQVSVEDEDDWREDVNGFVTEELSLSPKYTCRTACSDLFLEMADHALEPLIDALKTRMISLASAQSEQAWRPLEASLFLLETVLVPDRSYGQQLGQIPTIDQLLQIISNGVSSANVFLRARSYIFSGTLCRNLKDILAASDIPEKLFNSTLQASSTDSSFIVRACCQLAIQRFLSAYPRRHSKATQMAIVESVSSLVADAADETPSLLVDSLEAAIKISPDLAILPDSQIIALLFLSAAKDASNIQLTSDTFEAFEYLAQNISADHYQKFCETAIPPLVAGLSTAPSDDELPNATLIVNLLSILVDHAPTPLPSGLVDFVFPKVANILLVSDDNQLLQYGSEFVAHIIQHDPEQLRNWRDIQGKSGVEVVLNITARLLNPAVEESSAMCVGEVVSEIVDKYGRDLGELLGQLLSATAHRLASASNPMFIQNLILVYAHMVTIDPQGVVDFLAEVELEGSTGLESVVRAWLANFDVFKGFQEIRLNVLALAKLYMLHDQSIESIPVQGDLIVEDTNVIITRSRAKNRPYKFTTIPAHVKIVKLLIKELGAIPSNSNIASRAELIPGTATSENAVTNGDGEDDDWEDDFNPAEFGMTMSELQKLARSESNEFDSDAEDGDDAIGYFDPKGGDDETNETLITFFRTLSANEPERFEQIRQNYCSPTERDILKRWQPDVWLTQDS
ncbi:armadillo-type protein [Lipomyces tetrasporus]